jgi:pimeloyl-ACP methyl ester carboxylesterase
MTPELPLSVERYGSSGPHMLLIHGFAASTFTWRHWIPVLEREYRVIAVDLKGHGAAPAPPGQAYGPFDHADSLIELLDSVDPAELILVGHSMGGGIALLLALRLIDERPGLLRAVVLVSGAAYPQPLPPFVRWARKAWWSRVLFRLLPKRALIKKVLESIVFDPSSVSVEQIEAYAAPMRRSAHRRALLETARQIVPPDLPARSRRFGEIPVPTLALWGRTDNVVPLATGRRLEREMADARLVILEECGHIPPEERPEESLQVVLRFLRDVAEGAPSES